MTPLVQPDVPWALGGTSCSFRRALSHGSQGTALTPAPAQVIQLNDLYSTGWAGGAVWGVLTASCAVPVPKSRAPQGWATPSLVHCVPLRNVSDFPSDLLLILLFLLVYPNSLL